MLPQYKTKTNIFIGLAIALWALVIVGVLPPGPLFQIAQFGLMITGCVFYAKAKGYHGAFGLFGLLNILGLIILVCLKDKCK